MTMSYPALARWTAALRPRPRLPPVIRTILALMVYFLVRSGAADHRRPRDRPQQASTSRLEKRIAQSTDEGGQSARVLAGDQVAGADDLLVMIDAAGVLEVDLDVRSAGEVSAGR